MKDINNDKYYDNEIRGILEEVLSKEVRNFKNEEAFIELPDYSDDYKRFINDLAGRKIYNTGKRKKWFIGAACCDCLIIVLSLSTLADMRGLLKKAFIIQRNNSMSITQKNMYFEYDLDSIPDSWEYIFVPYYLPDGFETETMEGSDEKIEIIFKDKDKNKIDYTLYKNIEFSEDDYDKIDNDDGTIYYSEKNGVRTILTREADIYIKISTKDLDKDELIQIIKNVKLMGI